MSDSVRHKLEALASNLWWVWQPRAKALFQRLTRPLGRAEHNPHVILASSSEPDEKAFGDAGALELDDVYQEFQRVISTDDTWCRANAPEVAKDSSHTSRRIRHA